MKFLINTLTNWDEPPRTRHQIAQAFSRKYEVVFVASNITGWPAFRTKKINKNLTILTPVFPIDSRIRYRIPLLNELYHMWLFRKMIHTFREYEVINFDFTAHLIHRYFWGTVYYCNDNFTSISKKINPWPVYKYHAYCEKKVIAGAKLCIGTSKIITTNLLRNNSRSYEITLGGPDIEEFGLTPNPKNDTTKPLNIGLVGFIKTYNLSVRLVNDLLSEINCRITLIGPMDPDFYDQISAKEKINYMGILTGKELLMEVNRFDVAIAPYLDRKIEEGGLPNKLLIYLAMGKPVVLSDLKSLHQLNLPDKLIYPVVNSDDFSKEIKKAHDENCDDLIRLRTQYAKDNTWEKRVDHIIELLCYS